MKRKVHKFSMGKRHKRLLAAVAGAAFISTTMLAGLHSPKAHAAVNPATQILIGNNAIAQTADITDPVQVVKNNAATFGFNSNTDRFSLSSKDSSKAIVQVRTARQTFKVDLVRNGKTWKITTIRGIGDSRTPATYRPASLFPGAANNYTATLGYSTSILYESADYADWAWREAAYPRDMSFGVLLENPRGSALARNIPDAILKQLDVVNFGRYFALYAHLGTVKGTGYGIAFERVQQHGNDYTVTVRTRSPELNKKFVANTTDSLFLLDRNTLDFSDPIRIMFVDQNGTTLATYTITSR